METLLQFITRLNLQMEAVYLGKKIPPFSGKSKYENFHWRCDLTNLQGRLTHTTEESKRFPVLSLDFYLGLGNQGFRKYDSNLKLTNEWRYATDKERKDSFSTRKPKPIPPTLLDVLSNIQMTCKQLDCNPLWPDWANDMGCEDSIVGRQQYEACVDELIKFRTFMGWTEYNKFLKCEEC